MNGHDGAWICAEDIQHLLDHAEEFATLDGQYRAMAAIIRAYRDREVDRALAGQAGVVAAARTLREACRHVEVGASGIHRGDLARVQAVAALWRAVDALGAATGRETSGG